MPLHTPPHSAGGILGRPLPHPEPLEHLPPSSLHQRGPWESRGGCQLSRDGWGAGTPVDLDAATRGRSLPARLGRGGKHAEGVDAATRFTSGRLTPLVKPRGAVGGGSGMGGGPGAHLRRHDGSSGLSHSPSPTLPPNHAPSPRSRGGCKTCSHPPRRDWMQGTPSITALQTDIGGTTSVPGLAPVLPKKAPHPTRSSAPGRGKSRDS